MVGVAAGVSVGGGAATASAGTGMEVGGMGRPGGELPPTGPPPTGAATGPSGPNGSDSRKSAMLDTPQLARLSPRTIKSSTAHVDLASDGKGMP